MTGTATDTSHKQILKSTSILGGAQVVEIITQIARSKIIAILLGPAGVGVIGIYQSILDLMRSIAGLGLQSSAVREIAQAVGSEEEGQIAKTVKVFRCWVWFTAFMGVLLMLLLCRPISRYTFGDAKSSWAIAVLSIALLFRTLWEGQLALLQGFRKVRLMAFAKVWGVVAAFILTVPLYWYFGLQGIVPAFILTMAISFFFSWHYCRKLPLYSSDLGLREIFQGGLEMVRLGIYLVVAGLFTRLTMYFVRAFISNQSGVDEVGQFQAAWNLSSFYLAAILQAMAADYFPRLSAVNQDNRKVVQLVNEQTEVALLMAGPLIVGMLAFMKPVVYLLYSSEFTQTVEILRWQLAGTFFKLISWPIGFIILAKGGGRGFVFTEASWNLTYICLVLLGWKSYGVEATGIAYLISYLIYLFLLLFVGRTLSSFLYSVKSLKLIIIFGALTLLSYIASKYLAGLYGYGVGLILFLVAASISWIEIRKLVDVRAVFKKNISR